MYKTRVPLRDFVRILLVLALCAASLAAFAQKESVKPGINKSFQNDPDVEFYIKTFEGEDRAIFAHRNEILDALHLEPGTDIADIGAGTGFFSRMFANAVGPKGTVYAVDIADNFIEHIEKTAKEEKLRNLKAVLCDERSTKLKKASVDIVFICDTYHHFEYPYDTMASIYDALRPGGQVVIVDFERIEGITGKWALNHVRCGKGTVTDEVKDAGFDFVEEVPVMDHQYVIRFTKRG
ncbi:MAG: methyltransferase domain-containing protein [Candidatus Hydrogenedentes bacterium]|nr:methyltransferase domain-containing protein [Candidatus Hydrogenedentota bacterium]